MCRQKDRENVSRMWGLGREVGKAAMLSRVGFEVQVRVVGFKTKGL